MTAPDDPEKSEHSIAEVDEAVLSIPPFERRILILHRIDDMTYTQIAARLGISERRVERAIARSLTMFRRALRKIDQRR